MKKLLENTLLKNVVGGRHGDYHIHGGGPGTVWFLQDVEFMAETKSGKDLPDAIPGPGCGIFCSPGVVVAEF